MMEIGKKITSLGMGVETLTLFGMMRRQWQFGGVGGLQTEIPRPN